MPVLRGAFSFRLFRVPIQVQIWFLVTLLFLGIYRLQPLFSEPFLAITTFIEAMIVATVAVLVHEMAHALQEHSREQMAKTVATRGAIELGAALFGLGEPIESRTKRP